MELWKIPEMPCDLVEFSFQDKVQQLFLCSWEVIVLFCLMISVNACRWCLGLHLGRSRRETRNGVILVRSSGFRLFFGTKSSCEDGEVGGEGGFGFGGLFLLPSARIEESSLFPAV